MKKAAVHFETVVRNSSKLAVLKLDNGAVNGLSHAVRAGIVSGLEKAKAENVDAVVICGNNAVFCAGADIAEFEAGGWEKSPDLGDVINALDAFPKPTVAAIHGTALGGGLELALGCNYRVSGPKAQLGLPEVHLGILPGAQGTQRLPRVAGTAKALEMILKGAGIPAKDALASKVVDALAEKEEQTLETGLEFASKLKGKASHPRISQMPPAEALPDAVYMETAKKLSQRGHVTAPKIVEAVRAATSKDITFRKGVETEAKLFRELMASPEAAGLQHMFFAERNCSKVPGVDPRSAKDVKKAGIIGAGTMGSGIAMCFLNRKIPVVLVDAKEDMLKRGLASIEGNYRRSSAFKAGKMTEDDLKKTMSLISTSTNTEDFKPLGDCDIVIEAVFENLDLKKGIFAKLDKVCKPSALLCTNTSYLSVDDIASATKRPEAVMGTHFFSPANVMKLLENVKGSKTSNESIATAMKIGKEIGKTAVLSGNAFGFIGNRLFESYCVEAILLLEEGATPEQVDDALGPKGFGMAMGPLAVLDLAGNDIGQRIRREAYYPFSAAKGVKGKRAITWMSLADELCDKGRLGQKTGKGWYSYAGEDKRKGLNDAEVIDMARKHAQKMNIKPNPKLSPSYIVERTLFSMANEGFRVLEEKVSSRSSDIDVVFNYGYGFPRFRGGPMHFVDHVVGLKNMRTKMLKFLEEQPDLPDWHFKPAPLLEQLVKEGKTLKDYERGRA